MLTVLVIRSFSLELAFTFIYSTVVVVVSCVSDYGQTGELLTIAVMAGTGL